jgi:hypothetical protein
MELKDLRALEEILNTLEPLNKEEQIRVLRWTVEKLGMESLGLSLAAALRQDVRKIHPVTAAFERHTSGFQSTAEFLAAADLQTDADRVLCAALYLQDLSGDAPERTLTGKEINDALKELGHGVKNITDCINTLKNRKPQHMIQIRKSGKSNQSWKEYRVTNAGSDYIFRLISEGSANETD